MKIIQCWNFLIFVLYNRISLSRDLFTYIIPTGVVIFQSIYLNKHFMSLIPTCGLLDATVTRRELTLPSVYWSSCCSICVVFCRSLFVLLSFCFSPLYCQFFYLQLLIAPSECSLRRSSTYQCYSPWRNLTVLEEAMLAITPPMGIEKWNFHSVRIHCITA